MIHKLILYVLVFSACVLAMYTGETKPVPYRIYRRGTHDSGASSSTSSDASTEVDVSFVANPNIVEILEIAIDNTEDEEKKSYLKSVMHDFKTSGKDIITGKNWEDVIQVVAATVSLIGESGLSLVRFNDPAGTLDGLMAMPTITSILNNFRIEGFLKNDQAFRRLDLVPLQDFTENVMILTAALNQLIMQTLPLIYGEGIENVNEYSAVTVMHSGFLALNMVQLAFKKRAVLYEKMVGALTFLRTLSIRRNQILPVSTVRDRLLDEPLPASEVSEDILEALQVLNKDQCLGIVQDGNRVKLVPADEYTRCPDAITAADVALVARQVDSESGLGAIIADTSGNVFPVIILLIATLVLKVLGSVNDQAIAISLLVLSVLLELWMIVNSSMEISASLKQIADKILGREDPALRASIDNDLGEIARDYPEFQIDFLTKKGAVENGLQMTYVSWWIHYDENFVLTPSVRKPLQERLKTLSAKHRLSFYKGEQFAWMPEERSDNVLKRRGLGGRRISLEQGMSMLVESFDSLIKYAENERKRVLKGFRASSI